MQWTNQHQVGFGLMFFAALGAGCGDDATAVEQSPTSTTVFVDAAASPGGDGSFERPFRTVREALEIDRPIEVVALAGGRYPAPASWDFEAPLTILAHTEEPTALEAEAPAEALSWSGTEALVLRDLALGSPLSFHGGELELRQVSIEAVTAPALTLSATTTRIFDLGVGELLSPADQPGQGDGVVVEGGSLEWTGGTITQVPDRAVVLNGARATLASLTLASQLRAPLTVSDGSDVDASDLVIEDVAIGVFVDQATLRMDQIFVKNAGTAGVMASPLSDVRIRSSTLSDCPNGHISVLGEGASLTVEDSVLDGSIFASCIFASNATGAVVLRGNQVSHCAGSGITLMGLRDAVVEDNDIHDILPDPIFPELADGITVLDASARIANNHIHDTAGYGMSLNRAEAQVEGNQIGQTAEAAITVVEAGTGPVTVSGNTIDQATGAGVIALDGVVVSVIDNVISATAFNPADSFGDGVAFGMGAVVTVSGNTITGSARNGVVFLDGASGSIDGNQASGNGEYGILEFCSGAPNDVVIGANQLDGNTLGPMSLCSP